MAVPQILEDLPNTMFSRECESRVKYEQVALERRRTVRLPVPDHRRHAQLCVARHKVDVQLLDESADGFLISFQGELPLKAGQIMSLKTTTERWAVEVARLEQIGSEQQVGLKRVAELPVADQRKWRISAAVIAVAIALLAAVVLGTA